MKRKFLLSFVSLIFGMIGAVSCSEDNSGEPSSTPLLRTGRFVDNNDGTVTDNMTGLIWEKKTNVAGSVHFVGNFYTWSASGSAPDGTIFTDFLPKLNNSCRDNENKSCAMDTDCAVATGGPGGPCGFAGSRDWRLPGLEELRSIVDCSFSPCIDPIFGPTASPFYWSATTLGAGSSLAWIVSFISGNVTTAVKTGSTFARAVRP